MVETYIDYFRQLAVAHKSIRHDPSAEGNQGDIEKKRFTTWGADEAVTGLKTAVGYMALFLEMFELQTHGDNPFTIKGSYKGAVSIFDRVEFQNFSDQEAKAAKCFDVLEEILRKIWQDHYGVGKDRCNSPFAKIMFSELDIVYVGPLFDGVYGWRCEFSFHPRNVLSITSPPPDGTFV